MMICPRCKRVIENNTYKQRVCPDCNIKQHKCYAILKDGSMILADSEQEMDRVLGKRNGYTWRHICGAKRGEFKQRIFLDKDDEE